MSRDREFESRMQGMIYAYKIASEQGLDALQKEIKMRGITKLDIAISRSAADAVWHTIIENTYANMLTSFMYALHETEGWGVTRIKRLRDEFDKHVKNACDLDYLGEHYITLGDYARELNEKFNLGINLSVLETTQMTFDENDPRYHRFKTGRLIEILEEYGYKDAAEFIRERTTSDG